MAAEFDAKTADLAGRFCRGERAAVDQIVREICPAVYQLLHQRFRGRLDREEIEQLVFVDLPERAWEQHEKFDPSRGSLGAWLWTIAYHLAVDLFESLSADGRRIEVATDPDLLALRLDRGAGVRVGEPRSASESELRELVRRGLAVLSEPQQRVLLADAQSPEGSVSSRELGRDLGMSDATVRSHRQRGKQSLRKILLDLGIEDHFCCNTPTVFTNRGAEASKQADLEASDFERGTGNGERGTGNGERGTGNGEVILSFGKGRFARDRPRFAMRIADDRGKHGSVAITKKRTQFCAIAGFSRDRVLAARLVGILPMNAQSYLRRSAGALAIIMLMAAGCGRVGLERISSRDVSGNEERLSNSATVGAASHAPLPLTAATARKGQPPNQAETSVARQRRLVTLSCDFGIISPGTRPTKTVNLRNDSAVTWTVNSVSRNCACTVIAVDPHCIQPSAIASVEVELRGPFTTGDIDKDVMIEFHESAAPVVRLRAMARVRNPLTAFPDVVDLGQCLTGSTATEMLELHAFTSQQLSSIDVKGPDWLTIEQVGYPYPDAGSGPAQAWRFRITARTAALPLGGSEGIILARGVAPRGPEVSIPIFVYVKGPIDVSPREFFLGSVPRGEFAESCVTLTVAPQWRLSPRAAITISHDLSPEDVKIESQRRDWTVGAICGTVFVLRARYSPRCNRGVARGSVRVMISDGVLEQHCVEIPFCARAE